MKTISNYHTHTFLCYHGKGQPADYAEQAAKEGCLALGFSDHCPYDERFDDIWSDMRMSKNDIPSYMSLVQKAREISPFPVYAGFECEWDSRYKSWYSDELLGHYGAQYLILGSHWVTDGHTHAYAPEIKETKLMSRYIDQTIDGMQSGLFKFLAHPDLFMMGWKEWDSNARAWLKALLDAAVDLHLPIEINGLGITRTPNETSKGMRYTYPYAEFWEMVSSTNAAVICNSDAHSPSDVIMNAWKARDFAGRFGIEPIDTLDI